MAVGAVALVIVGYAGLRGAGAFAVDSIRVTGAEGAAQRAVLTATDARAGGRSLLAVDPTALARSLQAVPYVQRAHVDRGFPHTLRVTIVPERPVATARLAGGRLVVLAASGRILPAPRDSSSLPAVIIPAGLDGREGGYVALAGVRREVDVAASVPAHFPVALTSIAATTAGLIATAPSGLQIRLGDETELPAKLAIAGRILRGLSRAARGNVRYVEVSAPAFPAVMGAVPDVDTASLVPEDGVQIPSLQAMAAPDAGGTTKAAATGVQSHVANEPGAVVTDLFGHGY
jgi:cell division septal protein FtsQ